MIICEPSAVDFDRSHNSRALIGHTASFHRAGVRVEWVVNEKYKLRNHTVPVWPAFPYTIYDDVRKNYRFPRRLRKRLAYLRAKSVTLQRLCTLFAEELHIQRDDHILIPTTDRILSECVLSVIRGMPEVHRPTCHFIVMYEQAAWATGGYPYAKILQNLRDAGRGGRVFAYTETQAHAARLSRELATSVSAYPYPALPLQCQAATRNGGGKWNVGVLGGGRRDKGFERIPKIIDAINIDPDVRESVSFWVQRPRKEDRLEEVERKLESVANVILMHNTLSASKYQDSLVQADVLLLPYDRCVYEIRGSGLLSEGLANAKPYIYTSGTSLADGNTSGNGIAADSDEEFAQSLVDVLQNIDLFRRRAERAQQQYLQRLFSNPVLSCVCEQTTGGSMAPITDSGLHHERNGC